LNHWSTVFESEWETASSLATQAEALITLEARVAALCDAVSDIPKVQSHEEFRFFVIEALRIRHAWAVAAIQQLLCCSDANVPEINSGRIDTHQYIVDLAGIYEDARGDYEISDIAYVLDSVNLRANVPSDWLVSQGSSEITLIAPIGDQLAGTTGLGPDSLGIGSGIVIRKFGIPADETLKGAVERFGHLPATRGVVVAQDAGMLLDQPAVWWSIESDGWSIYFGLTISGQDLYFAEYACPAGNMAWCDSSSALLHRFAFITE